MNTPIVALVILLLLVIVGMNHVSSHNCNCVQKKCFLHFNNMQNKRVCYTNEGYSCNCSYRGITTMPIDLPKNTLVLNLQGNNITNLERFHFEEHTEMVKLDLRNNNIKDLPPKVFLYMTNLVELYLTTKKLHPKSFRKLKKLELLYIDGEGVLDKLHYLMFKPTKRLKNLTIHNGNIKTFENTFLNYSTALKYLDLRHNNIQEIERNAFSASTKIRWVDISHNRMQSLNEVFNGSKLEVLQISHNQLSQFPVALNSLSSIKQLDLSSNRLHSVSKENLLSLKNLEILILQGNQINEFPWYAISHLPIEVDLTGNNLTCGCQLLYTLYNISATMKGVCERNDTIAKESLVNQSAILIQIIERNCDVCRVDPCRNKAECVSDTSTEGFQCACLQGYTGKFCETYLPSTTSIVTVVTADSTTPSKTTTNSYRDITSKWAPEMDQKKEKHMVGTQTNASKYKNYFKTSFIVNIVLVIVLVFFGAVLFLVYYKYKKLRSKNDEFKYKRDVELK